MSYGDYFIENAQLRVEKVVVYDFTAFDGDGLPKDEMERRIITFIFSSDKFSAFSRKYGDGVTIHIINIADCFWDKNKSKGLYDLLSRWLIIEAYKNGQLLESTSILCNNLDNKLFYIQKRDDGYFITRDGSRKYMCPVKIPDFSEPDSIAFDYEFDKIRILYNGIRDNRKHKKWWSVHFDEKKDYLRVQFQ